MLAWGKSDVGLVRPTNQDAFCIDLMTEEGIALLAVCDGMGGANAGNVASKYAIEGFCGEVRRSLKPDMSKKYIRQVLQTATGIANQYVYEISRKQPEFAGMGTTLVACMIYRNQAVIANVGDSRAYLLHDAKLTQMTTDHSLVRQLVNEGTLTEKEAKSHPSRNLITRALGVEHALKADLFECELEEGDRLLLCSDGLTNELDDEEIGQTIRTASGEEAACDALVDAANGRGGTDNITVIVFGL